MELSFLFHFFLFFRIMSDSFILHDVMRKVKADGLFDSIRRDLISDLEQKVFFH